MWGAAPCVSIGPRPDQVRAIAFKVPISWVTIPMRGTSAATGWSRDGPFKGRWATCSRTHSRAGSLYFKYSSFDFDQRRL
jgi:hypothetical protein